MSSRSSWPLDSGEHLVDALREQGATTAEIAEWAPVARRLTEWPEQRVTAPDTQSLLAALAPALPQRSAVRQAVRDHYARQHGHLAWLLDTARAQVSILRPTFWLASAVVTLLGMYLELASRDSESVVLLRAIGPLLAYLGIGAAFRGIGLRMLESEVACPPSPLQLIIARLVIVLGYDVALGLCLGTALWLHGPRASHESVTFLAVTFHWLMPLLLVAGLALFLSLRMSSGAAAGVAYGVWIAVLIGASTLNQLASRISSSVTLRGEAAIGLVGLCLLALTLARLPAMVPRLFPGGE